MMKKHKLHIFLLMLFLCSTVLAFFSCSTTSALEEDEILYIGIDKIAVHDKKGTDAEDLALAEVSAALDYAPNGALIGSSYVRSPIQIGLWTYNALVDKPRVGFNKWMFNSFASTPVTINHVSPDVRSKIATNLLQNYGYFRGKVDYTLIDQKNPKKQKIRYDVKLDQPYLYDSIQYVFKGVQDSIVKATMDDSYLHKNGQFSTLDLTNEKNRITTEFHNQGFYYFRPDYIVYLADSTNNPYNVTLHVASDLKMPQKANRQYYFGNINAYIRHSATSSKNTEHRSSSRHLVYDDSITFTPYGLKVAYQGDRMPIKPRVLFKNFKFWKGRMFNQSKVDKTISNLYGMDIFSNAKLTFMPRDTMPNGLSDDTLDVRLDLTMDKLVDAELDFNITQKSNSQIGPHLGVTVSKRNAFHHGETLSVGLKGSYEWQTKKQYGEDHRIDSYELGFNTSLSYPWIAFPWLNKKVYKYPTTTKFEFNVNQLNRANYYQLMSFTVEAKYGFQTSRSWSHELTPLTITYSKLQESTERFDSIVQSNSALFVSLRDQFIPAIQYSIIYDNTWNTRIQNSMHFQATVKESGNALNAVNAILGYDYYQKDKKLLYNPYSQFLKLDLELKNIFHITETSQIATRARVGAIWTYGNSNYAPYSELFYVGGANSVRAFAIRDIGPGSYKDRTGRGMYLDQSGDLILELNAEYRFPIIKELQGALFLDAGNVWLMHENAKYPGSQLTADTFLKTLALGTGFGLRYDFGYLILRLDLGVGIHAPYDTGKSGYYNMNKFKDSVGLHFAVGYPF